jgi:hypothetical protein
MYEPPIPRPPPRAQGEGQAAGAGVVSLARTIRIWTCDACGHTAPWGDGWLSKLVIHRRPVPYDETIVVCSAACAKELDARRKRKRESA